MEIYKGRNSWGIYQLTFDVFPVDVHRNAFLPTTLIHKQLKSDRLLVLEGLPPTQLISPVPS